MRVIAGGVRPQGLARALARHSGLEQRAAWRALVRPQRGGGRLQRVTPQPVPPRQALLRRVLRQLAGPRPVRERRPAVDRPAPVALRAEAILYDLRGHALPALVRRPVG